MTDNEQRLYEQEDTPSAANCKFSPMVTFENRLSGSNKQTKKAKPGEKLAKGLVSYFGKDTWELEE